MMSKALSVFVGLLLMNTAVAVAAKDSVKFPKLKKDQLAVFEDTKYKVISFKTYADVDYSQDCFKKKSTTPACEAYRLSLEKTATPKPANEFMNNPAASYCKSLGGKSKIGMTGSKDELELCMFGDGSVFKSWGAFYKHFPKEVK